MKCCKSKTPQSNASKLNNESEGDKSPISTSYAYCSKEDCTKIFEECINEDRKSLNCNSSCVTKERHDKILEASNNDRITSYKEFKIMIEQPSWSNAYD